MSSDFIEFPAGDLPYFRKSMAEIFEKFANRLKLSLSDGQNGS